MKVVFILVELFHGSISYDYFPSNSVKDGEFRQYRGPRGENDIVSFVDDALWKDIEPVPWYSAPTSFQ